MALFGKKNNDNNVQFEILPKNIGIIMDGNGRWAKKRALPRSAGHKAGAEVFRTISKECGRLGLESATFYAFSTENWKRPKEEVDAIMRLFKDYLLEAKSDITAAGDMKMKFIGERDGMSLWTKLRKIQASIAERQFILQSITEAGLKFAMR